MCACRFAQKSATPPVTQCIQSRAQQLRGCRLMGGCGHGSRHTTHHQAAARPQLHRCSCVRGAACMHACMHACVRTCGHARPRHCPPSGGGAHEQPVHASPTASEACELCDQAPTLEKYSCSRKRAHTQHSSVDGGVGQRPQRCDSRCHAGHVGAQRAPASAAPPCDATARAPGTAWGLPSSLRSRASSWPGTPRRARQ
jgi:hypothetical protein